MKRIYSEQKTEVKEYIFSKTVYETKSIMDIILTHAIDVCVNVHAFPAIEKYKQNSRLKLVD